MISHFSSFHLFFSLSHLRCPEAFIRLSCHHTNSIALRSLHHCFHPLHSWAFWGKVLSCLVQHFSEQSFVVSMRPRNNNKNECPYFPPDLCLTLCTGGIPLPREFNIHVFKNQPPLSSPLCTADLLLLHWIQDFSFPQGLIYHAVVSILHKQIVFLSPVRGPMRKAAFSVEASSFSDCCSDHRATP